MNKPLRFLATLALAAALAACNRADQPAPTTTVNVDPAPAATAPAEPAATDAASAEAGAPAPAADPAAEAAAQQAVAAAATAGPPLVEGTDYRVISDGQPFASAPGKIEVAEVFGYTCPACAAFQPLVGAWKRQLPADVNFVYVPAAFGGQWDEFARAFYAAEALGVVDRTHDAMYRAIHVDRTMRGGADALARFYHQNAGVDVAEFTSAMNSFAVNSRLNRSKQFAQRSGVEGTPSIVIDGKYLVMGQTRDDQLRIANQLIARERAAR